MFPSSKRVDLSSREVDSSSREVDLSSRRRVDDSVKEMKKTNSEHPAREGKLVLKYNV